MSETDSIKWFTLMPHNNRLPKSTTSLKNVSCHDANFVITGGTAGCHNDNLQCCHDDKVGIMIILAILHFQNLSYIWKVPKWNPMPWMDTVDFRSRICLFIGWKVKQLPVAEVIPNVWIVINHLHTEYYHRQHKYLFASLSLLHIEMEQVV